MKKVIILMSTYNGEKYLEVQLDSIVQQTYNNIELRIRDDGSTDNTINILKKYSEIYPNIKISFEKNVGYPECFYRLTDSKMNADYFMFADQDDQWLKTKVERAINVLESENYSGALCYYSSYNICDSNLKFIEKSPNKEGDFALKDTLYEVCGLEFTMALNMKAMNLLQKYRPKISKARGTWMSMLFSSQGKIIYDNSATANYRRHESAVTNSSTQKFGLFFWRLKNFILNKHLKNYKNMMIEFRDILDQRLNTHEKNLLDLFCGKLGLSGRIRKIFYPRRLRTNLTDEVQLRFLFLFNLL